MSLHDDIMNLLPSVALYQSGEYRAGHSDARHAAAELALTADAKLERLRAALFKALEALEYHRDQTRPIQQTADAIDAARAVLAPQEHEDGTR